MLLNKNAQNPKNIFQYAKSKVSNLQSQDTENTGWRSPI